MLPTFADLARTSDPRLDLLALALAREFREVDAADALATLDLLGAELLHVAGEPPVSASMAASACAEVLSGAYRFAGERDEYDKPDNSMLDLVLRGRRGLPILLSV